MNSVELHLVTLPRFFSLSLLSSKIDKFQKKENLDKITVKLMKTKDKEKIFKVTRQNGTLYTGNNNLKNKGLLTRHHRGSMTVKQHL